MKEIKIPLSVVIIAKNEERAIGESLESVSWADEVIVVDDMSSDRTSEISKRHGARVVQRKMEIEGEHRNRAYALAKNEWVLSLDADEKVSPGLREEIIQKLSGNPSYVGFSIPLRNYIGNRWVRYGGWYPAAKLRLFRKERFRYEEVGVHPRAFLDGEEGDLKGDILHKGYPDFAPFCDSLNRQTSLEAEKWFSEKRKIGILLCFYKALDRFLRTFIFKQGFRDGFLGFMVAYYAGLYQVMSYAKYWEFKQRK